MNERDTSSTDWLDAQQQYWDAWLGLVRQTTSNDGNAAPSAAWVDGIRRWWETVSAAAPPTAHDFYQRLLAPTQSYLALTSLLASNPSQDPSMVLHQWLDQLSQAFKSAGEFPGTRADTDLRNTFAAWDLPLDTWRRTLSSALPIPGDFLRATHTENVQHVSAAIKNQFERFLASPALGYTREVETQYRKLAQLLLAYTDALQQYHAALGRIGVQSIENFRNKLAAQSAPVDSLRKLYDLWVDAFEEVHAQYTTSEEHAVLYGRMINALIAVKHHGSLLVDESLEGMNMPTRREINSLHQHVHDARRENERLRQELAHVTKQLNGSVKAKSRPRRKTKKC